jgi:hypothetical protein
VITPLKLPINNESINILPNTPVVDLNDEEIVSAGIKLTELEEFESYLEDNEIIEGIEFS